MKEKNHTIASCILQAFTGTPFLLAVAGILIALHIGGFRDIWSAVDTYKKGLLEYGTHFVILQTSLRSDALCLVLPVCSTLPFAASFLEDMESGFIKSFLPRSGRRHYMAGKILATGISGGMAPVLGISMYYNVLLLSLLPMERRAASGIAILPHIKDVGRICVLFFFTAMLFSLLGFLLSIVTSSKCTAFASPFVMEYVLIILRERYLKEFYMIDSREWMNPTVENWYLGEWGAFIFLCMLVLLVLLVLGIVMKGRLDEL